MTFSLDKSLEILESTPAVLYAMLQHCSADWTTPNEGGDSWSAYDIVGHLIHGELTDWMPRTAIILSDRIDKTFEPFDRFAQMETGEKKKISQLLAEFQTLRQQNLDQLRSLQLTEADLDKTGIHPAFGEVQLRQLLATWAVHDLGHIAQIARVMAKQYKAEVGPWVEYLRILEM
jgi:uncharacterized damage-inducible protein DinB